MTANLPQHVHLKGPLVEVCEVGLCQESEFPTLKNGEVGYSEGGIPWKKPYQFLLVIYRQQHIHNTVDGNQKFGEFSPTVWMMLKPVGK